MLDISDPDQLSVYLQRNGCLDEAGSVRFELLKGGVSCTTIRVCCTHQDDFVVKQALPRLRVASRWISSPERAHREALGIRHLEELLPAGSVPSLLRDDPENYLLAMQAITLPHDNWKDLLLGGYLVEDHARQFGTMLASIHSRAHRDREKIEPVFRDTAFFETLRMEAYYEYTARQVPVAKPFIESLLNATREQRITLVHGDYSPKNVLIQDGKLILLDHETIHWGDPMFDIGFSLTHFLSKANHRPDQAGEFARLALFHWDSYRSTLGPGFWDQDCEPRGVRHTLACLLARVHGRSPLEYLDQATRDRQAARVISLIDNPPQRIDELIRLWI